MSFTFPSAAIFDIKYLDYAYDKKVFKLGKDYIDHFSLQGKDYSTLRNKWQMCQFFGFVREDNNSFYITKSGAEFYESDYNPEVFIKETSKCTVPYLKTQRYSLSDKNFHFLKMFYDLLAKFYKSQMSLSALACEHVFCDLMDDDNYNDIDELYHLLLANSSIKLNDFGRARATVDYLMSSLDEMGFLKKESNSFYKVTDYFYENYISVFNEEENKIMKGTNLLIYGIPGCGKSYYVENILLPKHGISANNIIRTTFYQDYSNSDFVGQIIPFVDGEKITYKFNPGPFCMALKKALENPDQPFALIIEEINRGNAASIFGEIFQLLDRDETGKSRYWINNINIQKFLNDGTNFNVDKIYIPSNLFLFATMNTSDQNVFTLDNAFKRRWSFYRIKNDFNNGHPYQNKLIPGMHDNITWKDLVKSINEYIVANADLMMNEDKQIGIYFIEGDKLIEKYVDATDKKIEEFAYKLFEYLWDDIAKFSRTDWFKDAKTFDELIDGYKKNGQDVFKDGIIKKH